MSCFFNPFVELRMLQVLALINKNNHTYFSKWFLRCQSHPPQDCLLLDYMPCMEFKKFLKCIHFSFSLEIQKAHIDPILVNSRHVYHMILVMKTWHKHGRAYHPLERWHIWYGMAMTPTTYYMSTNLVLSSILYIISTRLHEDIPTR